MLNGYILIDTNSSIPALPELGNDKQMDSEDKLQTGHKEEEEAQGMSL